MRITIISFGFKNGIPPESDLLLDVRFIPNPYYVPELRDLDGRDERVRRFVAGWPRTREFLDRWLGFLDFLLPLYAAGGKPRLTIALGCTGGKHRSVSICEDIFSHLQQNWEEVALSHRDLQLI